MRAVATGGRESLDQDLIFAVLDDFVRKHDLVEIAHGGQRKWMPLTERWRGTDYWVNEWANDRRIPCEVYPVTEEEWRRLHKAAGPVRNRRMLDEFRPDTIIAFPGGSGTADCVKAALERGLDVKTVNRHTDGTFDVQEASPPKLF